MSTSRIMTLAAALLAAASLAAGAAIPAAAAARPHAQPRVDTPFFITGIGVGHGSTSAAAEQAAKTDLNGNFFGCVPPVTLVFDNEGSNGIWNAEVKAACQGPN